ncbi:MAG: sulfite exporter TauE/SafE family protein, partial [Propionivibrio sp.]
MEAAWVVAVILLGTFVQGLTGFGLALVSVPLLSLLLDVKVAVPVAGLFGWLITFPLVYRMRQYVQWRICLIMVVASLPGSLLGANLLKIMPAHWILVLMGSVLIFATLHSLLKRAVVH